MIQHAFNAEPQRGESANYVRLHSAVPDAVTGQIAKARIGNHTFFHGGDPVFGVLGLADARPVRKPLAADVAPGSPSVGSALKRAIDPRPRLIAGNTRVFRAGRRS